MQVKVVKDLPEGSVDCVPDTVKTATIEKEKGTLLASNTDMATQHDKCISEEEVSAPCDSHDSEPASIAFNLDTPILLENQEHLSKRKAEQKAHAALDDCTQNPDNLQDSSCKKQKRLLALDIVSGDVGNVSSLYAVDGTKSTTDEIHITTKSTINYPREHVSKEDISSGTKENIGNEANSITEVPELNLSLTDRHFEGFPTRSEWKPIEKELYSKGVEIFGKNRYHDFQDMFLIAS